MITKATGGRAREQCQAGNGDSLRGLPAKDGCPHLLQDSKPAVQRVLREQSGAHGLPHSGAQEGVGGRWLAPATVPLSARPWSPRTAAHPAPWQLPEGRAHHPKPQSTRQVLTKPIWTDSRDECETPRRLHFLPMPVFPLPEPEEPLAAQQETSSEGFSGQGGVSPPCDKDTSCGAIPYS